jgi:hypothetical protein
MSEEVLGLIHQSLRLYVMSLHRRELEELPVVVVR